MSAVAWPSTSAPTPGLPRRAGGTTGLALTFLPEPVRAEVTLAYALLRVADAIEGACAWTPDQRVEALLDFGRMVRDASAGRASRTPKALEAAVELLDATRAMPREARGVLARHLPRTVGGMAWFHQRAARAGGVGMRDLADLRAYCYVTGGIAFELVTELLLTRCAHGGAPAGELFRHAACLGEGLRLVETLGEARALEGRPVVPARVDRALVRAIAARDLESGEAYVATLRRAAFPAGVATSFQVLVGLTRARLARIARDGAAAALTPLDIEEQLARAGVKGTTP